MSNGINLGDLDYSLQLHVASFLPLGSRRNLGLCSHRFTAVFNDTVFWKELSDSLIIKRDLPYSDKVKVKDFYERFNLNMAKSMITPAEILALPIMSRYQFFRSIVQEPLETALRQRAISAGLANFSPLGFAFHLSQMGPVSHATRNSIMEKTLERMDGAPISNKELYYAMLAKLFKNGPIEGCSSELTLKYACAAGRLDLIQKLMKNPISNEARGEALVDAAGAGYENIVILLLQNSRIPEERLGFAVQWAAEAGYESIVILLLQHGCISELRRGCAVHCAAESNHVNIVRLLLKNGPIEDFYRGQTIIGASKAGYKDILRLL